MIAEELGWRDFEGTQSAFGGLMMPGRGGPACGGDVLRPGLFEDTLGPGFDFAFITFGFNLGNTQVDQSTGDADNGRTDCGTPKRCLNRTSRDERADSRNRQRANPGDPTQRPADDATRTSAADGADQALVFFSCAKSRVVPLLEKNTEISRLGNLSIFS